MHIHIRMYAQVHAYFQDYIHTQTVPMQHAPTNTCTCTHKSMHTYKFYALKTVEEPISAAGEPVSSPPKPQPIATLMHRKQHLSSWSNSESLSAPQARENGGKLAGKQSVDKTSAIQQQRNAGAYTHAQAQGSKTDNKAWTDHASTITIQQQRPKQAVFSSKLVKKAENHGAPGIDDCPEPPETVDVSVKPGIQSQVKPGKDVRGKENNVPAQRHVKQALAVTVRGRGQLTRAKPESESQLCQTQTQARTGNSGGMIQGCEKSDSESECDEPELPAEAPQTRTQITGEGILGVNLRDHTAMSSGHFSDSGGMLHAVQSAKDRKKAKNVTSYKKNQTQIRTGIGRELERRSPPPLDEDEDVCVSRCVQGSMAYGVSLADNNNTRLCVDGCVIEVEVKFDDEYHTKTNSRMQFARSESESRRQVNWDRRHAQMHFDDECCGDIGGNIKGTQRGAVAKACVQVDGGAVPENMGHDEQQREVGCVMFVFLCDTSRKLVCRWVYRRICARALCLNVFLCKKFRPNPAAKWMRVRVYGCVYVIFNLKI
jgi:hypothetical protein